MTKAIDPMHPHNPLPPACAEALSLNFQGKLYDSIRRAQHNEEFMKRFKKWRRAKRKAEKAKALAEAMEVGK